MLKRLLDFFTSLRLTVVCLIGALLLVFAGTLAQVHQGLYEAQARYFKSFFVWWAPGGGDWQVPVFPGGYLLGAVLLVNLLAAHARRFELSKQKIGLFMIHFGLILLLLGQLLTDMLATESSMRLIEGQAKNYSEDFRANELVVIDTSLPDRDQVVSLPERLLAGQREIAVPQTPFTLRVKHYWPNVDLATQPVADAVVPGATEGVGKGVFVIDKPGATRTDERSLPCAAVEILTKEGSLGTWLVSSLLASPQAFNYGGRTYEIALRFLRYYQPFSVQLLKFRHEKYPGTDTPKAFSSRVRLRNPATGEDRELLIYMNNPLRYQGTTYYQGGFDPNDDRVSILQVVRNPGWLTPYFSCALVGLGLTVQFLSHLGGFIRRRVA